MLLPICVPATILLFSYFFEETNWRSKKVMKPWIAIEKFSLKIEFLKAPGLFIHDSKKILFMKNKAFFCLFNSFLCQRMTDIQ